MTLDFCPNLDLNKPLCKGSGLEFTRSGRGLDLLPVKSLGNPWVNLRGRSAPLLPGRHGAAIHRPDPRRGDRDAAQVGVPQSPPATMQARRAQSAAARATRAAGRVERSAGGRGRRATAASPSDAFAIIMSGDGGWAGLDQDVAAALSAKGIPVVGLDSLRYFWTARTPEGLAADTDRLIRYYAPHFGKQRVLLIGYSQGADVLPFAVTGCPRPPAPALR